MNQRNTNKIKNAKQREIKLSEVEDNRKITTIVNESEIKKTISNGKKRTFQFIKRKCHVMLLN